MYEFLKVTNTSCVLCTVGCMLVHVILSFKDRKHKKVKVPRCDEDFDKETLSTHEGWRRMNLDSDLMGKARSQLEIQPGSELLRISKPPVLAVWRSICHPPTNCKIHVAGKSLNVLYSWQPQ